MRAMIDKLIDRTVKQRVSGSYGLYGLARSIVRAYENHDVNIGSNGEHWLQRRIASRCPSAVFDIGANRGEWAAGMLDAAPDCVVHCYEPVPETFALLEGALRGHNRIELNRVALSDRTGEIEIHSVEDQPELSSIHVDHSGTRQVASVRIPTRSGTEECQRLGLDRVDFIKVDTEGHDHAVLSGFSGALSENRIDFIQFEYNSATLAAGRSLRDFFDLLTPNYVLCRLLPQGLEACGYHPVLDNFAQTNWVAVSRPLFDPALVKAFRITKMRGLPLAALERMIGDAGDMPAIPASN